MSVKRVSNSSLVSGSSGTEVLSEIGTGGAVEQVEQVEQVKQMWQDDGPYKVVRLAYKCQLPQTTQWELSRQKEQNRTFHKGFLVGFD